MRTKLMKRTRRPMIPSADSAVEMLTVRAGASPRSIELEALAGKVQKTGKGATPRGTW